MLKKKLPSFPGVPNVNGTWWGTTDYNSVYDNWNRPFYVFANYSDAHNNNPYAYEMSYDRYGPQFFAPSQCLKTFDYMRPKKGSPIIAIVG